MDGGGSQLSWIRKEVQLNFDEYIDAYNELAEKLNADMVDLLDVVIAKHERFLNHSDVTPTKKASEYG